MSQSDDELIERANDLFVDSTDELLALFDEDANSERARVAWAALHARGRRISERNQRRKQHPWLPDLIRALFPSKSGMERQAVMRELRKIRQAHGVNIPPNFDQAAQPYYDMNCEGHKKFIDSGKPETEALFYSPEGKGAGIWAVHHDRALAWLKKQGKTLS